MSGQKRANALRTQRHVGVTWVDVDKPDTTAFAELEKRFNLHPVHLSESIQKVQHIEVEREDGYLFVVLHYPIFEFHSAEIRMGQVGVFLGKDFLVTVHTDPAPFIDSLFMDCEIDNSQAADLFGHGSAYVLYKLIAKLLANIAAIADIVENELDEIEDIVFNDSRGDTQRIGRVRQKIVRLRRLIGPKRLVLQDLAERIGSFSGNNMVKYYSINVKMVNRLWEAIEESKETVEIFKDADFTASTERTNRTLSVLTLIFTFTIPATVIASLYGMNVPLPGGLNHDGPFTSFAVVVGVSTVLAVGMYYYFKKKRWF